MRSAVLALPLLLAACFERVHPTAETMVHPVEVTRVSNTPLTDSRLYPGTIKPRREADIAFRAGGRIVTRLVDTGARVAPGDVLARLDPTDLALSMRSAEADLASARAQLIQAAADATRSRTLLAQGWTPAATDETKQAAARTAAERVHSTQAALTLARNRLDYAELRAPDAGIVTAVLADPGTVMTEGQPVIRLAQTGAMEIEVSLPEDSADLAPGRSASVSAWARPDTTLPAHLRELARSADPRLRTYTARFALDDPPGWLALGMSATLRLDRAGQGNAATLPASALADRGAGPMVWIVNPETGALTAQRVAVQALRQDTALVTGLTDGQLVVTLGVQKLDPAARVRVAEAAR